MPSAWQGLFSERPRNNMKGAVLSCYIVILCGSILYFVSFGKDDACGPCCFL